ncbi:MAG: ABC transporter permease [Planctomycetota bacterium]|nr:ABC transporter permease [Planctomycetota bacterium]
MSLWKIAWRSIQRRWVASLLTAISMALGVGLVVAVLLIVGIVQESFRNNTSLGYNLIVGAPTGGRLQLVLNTVYYLSQPIGNVNYNVYQNFLGAAERTDGRDGIYRPYVDFAIPVCLGDYYQGFRVVGTTAQLFDEFQFDPERQRKFEFTHGRNFRFRDAEHGFFEAVLGAAVVRETKLKLGDKISVAHGEPSGRTHESGFTIVGILKSSGTPVDRAVFVNMEGFLLLDGHAKPVAADDTAGDQVEHAVEPTEPPTNGTPTHGTIHDLAAMEPLPIEQRQVTSLLVKTSSLLVTEQLRRKINDSQEAQAVLPVREIYGLFDAIIRPIQQLLLVITALICVVSGIGILVSIYNSMSDRQHEIAVMRALGAGRSTVMWVVLFESILLSVGGGLLGWIGGHAIVAAVSPQIEARTGVQVGLFQLAPRERLWELSTAAGTLKMDVSPEVLLVPCLIVLAILVGLLPALAAYRTDVSRALSASP